MLGSAIAAPHNDERGDVQRNLSAAEQFMRERKEQNLGDHAVTSTAATTSEASVNNPPRIPEWLNHARAQEIPPGVPALPQGNVPQVPCRMTSTVAVPQLDLRPAVRPGHRVLTHYQIGNGAPGALGIFNPHVQNPATRNNTYLSMTMQHDRAGGGRSTSDLFQPDYDHYERAAGKRLPFPDINNLVRNERLSLM